LMRPRNSRFANSPTLYPDTRESDGHEKAALRSQPL